jgi:hypothetical protein
MVSWLQADCMAAAPMIDRKRGSGTAQQERRPAESGCNERSETTHVDIEAYAMDPGA